jgi:hypothetical protein
MQAYKDETAHHVEASAEAAEHNDLEAGDHVLSTGLESKLSAFLLIFHHLRMPCAQHRMRVVLDHVICHPSTLLLCIEYAPSPRSSVRRASGIRVASKALCSRA